MRFTVFSFILLAVILLIVYFLVRRKWLPGALLAAAILTGFLAGGNVAGRVTVEAGTQSVEAKSFVRTGFANSAVFVSDLSNVDLNMPGDYPVQVRVGLRTFHRVLRVKDTVSPTATVTDVSAVSVSMPPAEAFIAEIRDATPVTVQYAVQPDMRREGEQTVDLILTDAGGNTASLQAKLTVFFDHQAPTIQLVKPLQIYLGSTPDYLSYVTITDDIDGAPVLSVDDSMVRIDQAGSYDIIYNGADASGNLTRLSATFTVIEDNTAPVIYGVRDISLYAGSTVSYRSGILVEDDMDENPSLAIDASGVDLSQPGNYVVTYTATDFMGNETQISANVVVKKQPNYYVDEAVIYAKADEILASIITDDMTNQEKVEAVHKWIHKRCSYYGYADKTDWLQAAYRMMNLRKGNCFSYYSVSRLFFDRLGLPNIMVRRAYTPHRPYNHFWNMVSIDGGQTWYHFDATRLTTGSDPVCLLTDAQMEYFNRRYLEYYYYWDTTLVPATPEETLVEFK